MSHSMMSQHPIRGTHYGFSATRIDDLGAAEYTLVAIAADASGSVSSFKKRIESAIAEVARAAHPQAERRNRRERNLGLGTMRFDIPGQRSSVFADATDSAGESNATVDSPRWDASEREAWRSRISITTIASANSPAPASISPAGRTGESVRPEMNAVAQPPTIAPSVPPIPIKANSRLPCSTLKMSTMYAQKTLVVNRLMTLNHV